MGDEFLRGILAGSSPGRAPGLRGGIEAVVDPERVIARGPVTMALRSIESELAQIETLGRAGDVSTAFQLSRTAIEKILRSGVDRLTADQIMTSVVQPAVDAFKGRVIESIAGGVDLATPRGREEAIRRMLSSGLLTEQQLLGLPGEAARTEATEELAESRRLQQQETEGRIGMQPLQREAIERLTEQRKQATALSKERQLLVQAQTEAARRKISGGELFVMLTPEGGLITDKGGAPQFAVVKPGELPPADAVPAGVFENILDILQKQRNLTDRDFKAGEFRSVVDVLDVLENHAKGRDNLFGGRRGVLASSTRDLTETFNKLFEELGGSLQISVAKRAGEEARLVVLGPDGLPIKPEVVEAQRAKNAAEKAAAPPAAPPAPAAPPPAAPEPALGGRAEPPPVEAKREQRASTAAARRPAEAVSPAVSPLEEGIKALAEKLGQKLESVPFMGAPAGAAGGGRRGLPPPSELKAPGPQSRAAQQGIRPASAREALLGADVNIRDLKVAVRRDAARAAGELSPEAKRTLLRALRAGDQDTVASELLPEEALARLVELNLRPIFRLDANGRITLTFGQEL